MTSLSFLFSCTFPAKPWQIPTVQTGPSTLSQQNRGGYPPNRRDQAHFHSKTVADTLRTDGTEHIFTSQGTGGSGGRVGCRRKPGTDDRLRRNRMSSPAMMTESQQHVGRIRTFGYGRLRRWGDLSTPLEMTAGQRFETTAGQRLEMTVGRRPEMTVGQRLEMTSEPVRW